MPQQVADSPQGQTCGAQMAPSPTSEPISIYAAASAASIKATLLTQTYRKGIGYGDLIAAIMGFLVGLENSKPQMRCHTLAAIAAGLLFFCRIRRCLERLPQPQSVSIIALISSALYILILFTLKFFENIKRKLKTIATIETQQHQNYCRDYLNSLGRLMPSKDNILESLPHHFYCNRLPYGMQKFYWSARTGICLSTEECKTGKASETETSPSKISIFPAAPHQWPRYFKAHLAFLLLSCSCCN